MAGSAGEDAAGAGGANNQLETAQDGEALRARGILYAPDYVMNAGGVTKMCGDYFGWPQAEVTRRVEGIGDRLAAIFAHAAATKRATNLVADEMAEGLFARRPAEPLRQAS